MPDRETFLRGREIFLRGREIFTSGREIFGFSVKHWRKGLVRHLVRPLVPGATFGVTIGATKPQKISTDIQAVKCQV